MASQEEKSMENGLTASDVALLGKDSSDCWGGGSMMWIFALLILAGGGLWGNNRFDNAIGYQNLATQSDVQRGFDAINLEDQNREILSAISDSTLADMRETSNAKYDTISELKDVHVDLLSQLGEIKNQQSVNAAAAQNCCCQTLRAIDGVNYNSALNTAAINKTTTEQTQKILDAISANRMADMQSQINALQLQQAMCGVVKYPTATTYYAGANPFYNCGTSSI